MMKTVVYSIQALILAFKENIGMFPLRIANPVRIIAKYVKVQLHAKNAKLVIN